jgi:uncharacterized protein (DUF697 family)
MVSVPSTTPPEVAAFLAQPYEKRKLIVVIDDADVDAAVSGGEAAVAALSHPDPSICSEADKRVDAIIRQMTGQVAAAAVIPAAVNWMVMTGIEVAGVMRIAAAYGRSIEEDRAKELLKKFTKLLGTWLAMAIGTGKILSFGLEATGAGYGAGVALDAAISASSTFAFGHAAKAYLKGAPDDEVKSVARAAFKTARKELPGKLSELRKRQAAQGASDTNVLMQLQRDCDVVPVPDSIAKLLDFPTKDHPHRRTVYVGNPVEPAKYYTFAQFHACTFEHKYFEACRLVEHLRPKWCEVRCVQGRSRMVAAKAGIAAHGAAASGGVSANAETGSQQGYRASYDWPPNARPEVPSGTFWFDGEPTWRKLADSRLHSPIRDFDIDVFYTNDYGINADLSGKLCGLNLGVDLGGAFEKNEATHWKIVGEFQPFSAAAIGS